MNNADTLKTYDVFRGNIYFYPKRFRAFFLMDVIGPLKIPYTIIRAVSSVYMYKVCKYFYWISEQLITLAIKTSY